MPFESSKVGFNVIVCSGKFSCEAVVYTEARDLSRHWMRITFDTISNVSILGVTEQGEYVEFEIARYTVALHGC